MKVLVVIYLLVVVIAVVQGQGLVSNWVDEAGENFTVWCGPNYTVAQDPADYLPKYNLWSDTLIIDMDLYRKPVITTMWLMNLNGSAWLDPEVDILDALSDEGADPKRAVLSKVNISGIEWYTAHAPKINGSGFTFRRFAGVDEPGYTPYAPKINGSGVIHVALIAYTNWEESEYIMIVEDRPEIDLYGFNETLRHVVFRESERPPGDTNVFYF